jgi:hypothetical protein
LQLLHIVGHLLLAIVQALLAVGTVRSRTRQLANALRNLALLAGQFGRALGGFLHVLRLTRAARLLDQAPSILDAVERGCACRVAGVGLRGRRPPHLVRGVLQPARTFGQVRRVLLTSQPLELPGHVLGLVGELPLASAATAARLSAHVLRPLTRALVFLLLARRQLLQAFEGRVNLGVLVLLLTALHLLVLIPQLVGLELEQIREILGARLTAPAPATTTAAHAHLHVAVHRFGPFQVLQRPLLGRQRLLGVPLA